MNSTTTPCEQKKQAQTQKVCACGPINTKGLKYLWRLKPYDELTVRNISHRHNLSLAIAHLLFSRNYVTKEQISAFLFTSFENDVAHPSLLSGSTKAAERILEAVKNNEKILIFGDYDVDGITSTALLLIALIPMGANINYHLPNRKRDGYGLSTSVVEKAFRSGYKLIITVDNGITANEAASKAAELGIDLIITDHHMPHEALPNACSIINPNQPGCTYPFKKLAGVGVTFKLISLIYETKNLTLPQKIYELLMLGTVADVVPLVGENRFWVQHGLLQVNEFKSYSLQVLAQNSNLNKSRINSTDIGFMIAPQINALGRLDDSRDAVKFLVSTDQSAVEKIGAILKQQNEDRKKIDREIYEEIEHKINKKQINLDHENIIMDSSYSWPSGVIGLVAGKLMNNFGKPTFLFHLDKNGTAGGSCRSIPEFNVFEALTKCQDLLLSFGGHACAAGLKLAQKNIPAFKERLESIVKTEVSPLDLQPKLTIDAILDLPDMTNTLVHELMQLEPFGNENPEPVFLIKNVTLLKQPVIFRDKHVKVSIFGDGIIKPVIFFNRPELYKVFKDIADAPFDLVGSIIQNEWDGSIRTEINGIDIKIN